MTDRNRVDQLAAYLNFGVFFDIRADDFKTSPYSDLNAREIHLHPWDDKGFTFWTALHELGHGATTAKNGQLAVAQMFFIPEVLSDIESRAWLWALDKAGRALDDVGRATIVAGLSSYFRDGGPSNPFAYGLGDDVPEPTREVLRRVGPVTNNVARLVHENEPTHGDIAIGLWNAALRAAAQQELALAS